MLKSYTFFLFIIFFLITPVLINPTPSLAKKKPSLTIEEKIIKDPSTGKTTKVITQTRTDPKSGKVTQTVTRTVIDSDPSSAKPSGPIENTSDAKEDTQKVGDQKKNDKSKTQGTKDKAVAKATSTVQSIERSSNTIQGSFSPRDETTLKILGKLLNQSETPPEDISIEEYRLLIWAAKQYYKILNVTNTVGGIKDDEFIPLVQNAELTETKDSSREKKSK